MRTSKAGQGLIKRFEQLRLKAYLPTPNDVPTIGWGTTQGIQLGDLIDMETAQGYFERDLHKFEDCVDDACEDNLTQNQFDACVSLAYNIGCNAFKNSTLVVMINRRLPAKDIAPQFMRWDKQGGKVLAGLTRRRAAERDLFLS